MPRNPFLPKRPIRWQAGLAKGTLGIPDLHAECSITPQITPSTTYQKDPRGRKPKDKSLIIPRKIVSSDLYEPSPVRTYPEAGRLNFCAGPFLAESNAGWGANLDMVGLAHGPVGCGVFTQTSRLNLPGFVQGIESFTALHACTNLRREDLEDGGDAKFAGALGEIKTLFPLARGVTVLNEDPIALIDANVKGIAKTKARELGILIIPRSCENIGISPSPTAQVATALKNVRHNDIARGRYDVALPFFRGATGLVWVLAKLLRDIGLNPVHEITGSSTSDMARIGACKLVIGFAEQLDVPIHHFAGGYAQLLKQWFGMPLAWACFISPSATDASLRAIAAHFDSRIRRRAEEVILVNRKRVETLIAHHRPRLEGKLVIHFQQMTEHQLEPYRLLGMRIGNASGWTGKTGKWRVPRLVCDPDHPSEKTIDSYIAEAKPDLILHFGHSEARGEYDWRKRGQNVLPFTHLFDRQGNAFWGYDGFECFAATLDRALNSPWRKLLTPPWAVGDEL